jgi:hypothetical protein
MTRIKQSENQPQSALKAELAKKEQSLSELQNKQNHWNDMKTTRIRNQSLQKKMLRPHWNDMGK